MFKHIYINLTGPICNCETQDLTWTPFENENGFGLRIACNNCKTQLSIPRSKFGAVFRFDTPYPKGIEKKPSTLGRILRLVRPDPEEEEDGEEEDEPPKAG